MLVDPNDINVLRSARRMELKSKAVFSDGFYEEVGPVVLGGTTSIPDPHFNRISLVEPAGVDKALLGRCVERMVEGTPTFIDVPHEAAEAMTNLLAQNGYTPTGESRSSMVLTELRDEFRKNDELDITVADADTLDLFLELFLRGFETPEDLIPFAKTLFGELVPKHCNSGNSRLYIGTFSGEPVATLYLYYDGDEAGINMVSTHADFRQKGIAATMLWRSIEDARAFGVRILSLETRWNSAPERLYGRLGFKTIARHEIFTNSPSLTYGL